jgi:hypothetical protein
MGKSKANLCNCAHARQRGLLERRADRDRFSFSRVAPKVLFFAQTMLTGMHRQY